MTYAILLALVSLGFLLGFGNAWLICRPKLQQLKRLTDRDERGRFKGGKPCA